MEVNEAIGEEGGGGDGGSGFRRPARWEGEKSPKGRGGSFPVGVACGGNAKGVKREVVFGGRRGD